MMHCFSTSDSYQYKKMGFHPLILNHVKKYSVKWCEIEYFGYNFGFFYILNLSLLALKYFLDHNFLKI